MVEYGTMSYDSGFSTSYTNKWCWAVTKMDGYFTYNPNTGRMSIGLGGPPVLSPASTLVRTCVCSEDKPKSAPVTITPVPGEKYSRWSCTQVKKEKKCGPDDPCVKCEQTKPYDLLGGVSGVRSNVKDNDSSKTQALIAAIKATRIPSCCK